MTAEHSRIAVLGGTFDPVHNGHIAMAIAVREALDADESWLVPARVPHLRGTPVSSPQDRYDMLLAAAEGNPGLRVVDIELHRQSGSYTIDTLDDLQRRHPALEPWWILGADAARRIGEWHRSDELLARARFAVVQRAGTPVFDDAEARGLGMDVARTRVLDITPPDVSASTVRARLASGALVDDLVPAPVAAVINARRLYAAV